MRPSSVAGSSRGGARLRAIRGHRPHPRRFYCRRYFSFDTFWHGYAQSREMHARKCTSVYHRTPCDAYRAGNKLRDGQWSYDTIIFLYPPSHSKRASGQPLDTTRTAICTIAATRCTARETTSQTASDQRNAIRSIAIDLYCCPCTTPVVYDSTDRYYFFLWILKGNVTLFWTKMVSRPTETEFILYGRLKPVEFFRSWNVFWNIFLFRL